MLVLLTMSTFFHTHPDYPPGGRLCCQVHWSPRYSVGPDVFGEDRSAAGDAGSLAAVCHKGGPPCC